MSVTKSLLRELEKEAVITRKMLERVPMDNRDWKPHEKSMTLGQLATHIAEIPGWIGMVINTDGLDFAANPYQPTAITNTGDLITFFEKSLETGKRELDAMPEEKLKEIWTLRSGDQVYTADPKDETLRGCFCQVVHHRAQLGVYLRLLNIPIPGSYGPSADEMD
jgi:uncharacterized damage-inducible protein DinB